MKKPVVIIIIIVALLGGGALALTSMSKDEAPKETSGMPQQDDKNAPAHDDKKETGSVEDLTSQSEVTMDIKDFAFSKANIKIKKGTKVTWTNQDSAKHDITPTSGAEDLKKSALLAKGESFSFTFNTAGAYDYKCSPHPYMKGTVVVTE